MAKLYWAEKKTAQKNSDTRNIAEPLKPKKGMKISSAQWLKRQSKDPYVKKRQKSHYRSRAAFKLLEMDQKYRFLRPDMNVIDLGSAPGGWLQVLTEKINPEKNHIIGIDLVPIPVLPHIILIEGDIREEQILARIKEYPTINLVLSDLSSPRCGHAKSDALAQTVLAENALEFTLEILAPNGDFLCKLLQGHEEPAFFKRIQTFFKTARRIKPPASHQNSAEVYVLGQKRKSQ